MILSRDNLTLSWALLSLIWPVQLIILRTDFPDRCFITNHPDGHTAGYLFAQPQRLGPCGADHPRQVAALLQVAVTPSFDEPPIAIAPRMNPQAIALPRHFDFELKLANLHTQRSSTVLPAGRSDFD